MLWYSWMSFSQAKLFCSEKPFLATLCMPDADAVSNGCVNSEIKQTIISSSSRTCQPMKSSFSDSGRTSTTTGRGSGFSGGRDVITALLIATLAECRLCLVALFEYTAITRNRYVPPDIHSRCHYIIAPLRGISFTAIFAGDHY